MRTIIRSIRLLTIRDRIIFFLLTIARALTGFLDILAISLIGLVGTMAVGGKDPSQPLVLFGGKFSIDYSSETILKIMIAVFIIYLTKVSVSLALIRAMTRFLSRIDSTMASRSASYFIKGPYVRLRSQTLSTLNWTIGDSVYYAFFVPLGSFATIVADGTILILISLLMFIVDPVACVFALMYFGLTGILMQRLVGRSQLRAGKELASVTQNNMKAVEDAYIAYRDYFVYGLTNTALQRINTPRTSRSKLLGNIQFLNSVPRSISEVSLILGILVFVAWQFLSGSLQESIGVIAVFLASGLRIIGALVPVQSSFASLKSATSLSELAFDAIEGFDKASTSHSTSQTSNTSSKNVFKDFSPVSVEINHVDFQFPDSQEKTLSDLSLSVDPGSLVAFIGPSGAGKTTLIDLILGLFQPTNGDLFIGNVPASFASKSEEVRVAYVPQKPSIIHATIFENIALSNGENLGSNDDIFMEKILQETQLDELVSSLPDGIHTVLDGTQARLSGGQIQRIGLARALFSRPNLLILDEATSSLDAETEFLITEVVHKLTPETTVIVIAHRLSTVKNADIVHLMEDGRISDSGKLSELQKRNPLVERYISLMSFD